VTDETLDSVTDELCLLLSSVSDIVVQVGYMYRTLFVD